MMNENELVAEDINAAWRVYHVNGLYTAAWLVYDRTVGDAVVHRRRGFATIEEAADYAEIRAQSY